MFSEPGYGPLVYHKELPGHFETMRRGLETQKIWLVPGSIFEKSGDKIYNTTLVINPQGEEFEGTEKMFPFIPYREVRRNARR
jgi:predicted amidohydrolase